jgi:hypothetical protein
MAPVGMCRASLIRPSLHRLAVDTAGVVTEVADTPGLAVDTAGVGTAGADLLGLAILAMCTPGLRTLARDILALARDILALQPCVLSVPLLLPATLCAAKAGR